MSLRAMSRRCAAGHRHGGAGDEHRLEHGERCHGPRTSDVDLNPREKRGLLLRGKLEGNRPPWKLARGAKETPLAELVDLDHDAVGVEVERAPLLGPLVAEGDERVDPSTGASAVRPAAPGTQLFQRFAWVRPLSERVRKKALRPRSRRAPTRFRAYRPPRSAGWEERLAGLVACALTPLERFMGRNHSPGSDTTAPDRLACRVLSDRPQAAGSRGPCAGWA